MCNYVSGVSIQHCRGFFHVQYCLDALRQYSTAFLPVQRCSKTIIFQCIIFWGVKNNITWGFSGAIEQNRTIKTVLLRIFFCENSAQDVFVWKFVEPQRHCYIGFMTVLQRQGSTLGYFRSILRQHWTGFFQVQYCLEHLGQHCHGFLSVQCCPKSSETTLISLVQCCLESLGQHCTEFFMCKDVTGVSRQHCTELFPEQCCLEPLRKNCNFAEGFKLPKVFPGLLRQYCGKCCSGF